MADDIKAIKLIDEPDFRLVRVEIDGYVDHVLETRDGCDAMGAERWRKFEINGTTMKALFRFLVRTADKELECRS
jgi:hypothetical protein